MGCGGNLYHEGLTSMPHLAHFLSDCSGNAGAFARMGLPLSVSSGAIPPTIELRAFLAAPVVMVDALLSFPAAAVVAVCPGPRMDWLSEFAFLAVPVKV